jgi:hypothetical protein
MRLHLEGGPVGGNVVEVRHSSILSKVDITDDGSLYRVLMPGFILGRDRASETGGKLCEPSEPQEQGWSFSYERTDGVSHEGLPILEYKGKQPRPKIR